MTNQPAVLLKMILTRSKAQQTQMVISDSEREILTTSTKKLKIVTSAQHLHFMIFASWKAQCAERELAEKRCLYRANSAQAYSSIVALLGSSE